MTTPSTRWSPTHRPAGHDNIRGGLRFAAELVAMIGTPWALWRYSIFLAIAALAILIALPAVFGTPGDRPGGAGLIAVPGTVTVFIVVTYLAAAVVAAWVLWPWWVAIAVTALCTVVIGTEQTRWAALTRSRRTPRSRGDSRKILCSKTVPTGGAGGRPDDVASATAPPPAPCRS